MTTIAQDFEASISDCIVQSHMPVCFKDPSFRPPSHEDGGGSCVGYPSNFNMKWLWPYSKRMLPMPWTRSFAIPLCNQGCDIQFNLLVLVLIIVLFYYL